MRISKQTWLDHGLQVLARSGLKGLRIEPMAADLGVTKGSFYHHFKNRRDFQEQLIAYWTAQYVASIQALPPGPADRLRLLDEVMEQAFAPATEPEIAIRTWAQQDDMVREHVERADGARRGFVLDVFRPLAENESQARLMADMFFTMAIGSLTALPPFPPQRVQRLYGEFKRLYGLSSLSKVF